MTPLRRMVLTHVTAEERARLHKEREETLKKKAVRAYLQIILVSVVWWVLAVMLWCVDGFTDEAFHNITYYGIGCSTTGLMFVGCIVHVGDRIYLPPTCEEMNELGNELV